jgi:hypothetical protein
MGQNQKLGVGPEFPGSRVIEARRRGALMNSSWTYTVRRRKRRQRIKAEATNRMAIPASTARFLRGAEIASGEPTSDFCQDREAGFQFQAPINGGSSGRDGGGGTGSNRRSPGRARAARFNSRTSSKEAFSEDGGCAPKPRAWATHHRHRRSRSRSSLHSSSCSSFQVIASARPQIRTPLAQ